MPPPISLAGVSSRQYSSLYLSSGFSANANQRDPLQQVPGPLRSGVCETRDRAKKDLGTERLPGSCDPQSLFRIFDLNFLAQEDEAERIIPAPSHAKSLARRRSIQ